MIHSQNPNATYVQSYKKWLDEGYPVRKGQSGIAILVPYFGKFAVIDGHLTKVSNIKQPDILEKIKSGDIEVEERLTGFRFSYVFDISQTSCPTEDYPKFFFMGFDDALYDQICGGIEQYAQDYFNTAVIYKDLQSIALRGQNLVGKHTIHLNDKLKGSERLSTLIHEIAHQVLHQGSGTYDKTVSRIEFEADAFSVMLQSYFELPVTDSRKRHLSDNYHLMKITIEKEHGENSAKVIDDILDNLQKTFKREVEKISPYINPYLKNEDVPKFGTQYPENDKEKTKDDKDIDQTKDNMQGFKSGKKPKYKHRPIKALRI